MQAVILAGGRGARLAPYTTVLPKPLMPVGDMPILEILIRQLQVTGVKKVFVAVGHLASLIMAYFGKGEHVGMPIEYSFEPSPLGTAGPLSLIPKLENTFLAMNGDLLTDLDFRAMIRAHREAGAAATVGLYTRDVKIDLGVVETNACSQITHYREKPVYHYQVSMGVYVFEPTVLRFIPREMRLDMPELVRKLIEAGEHVIGYHHSGYWLDIGRPDDYQTAQDDFERMSSTLLGNGSAPSVHRQILLNDYARVSPAVPTNGRMQKSA